MNERKFQDTLNSIIQILEQYPDIELAIVFGSIAAGSAGPNSDLDLAIAGSNALDLDIRLQLIEELARSIGRPIDLIDLKTVGEPLLGQIIKGGIRVLGSNYCYAELLKKHLFNEADFIPYQSRILKERRKSWIGS